MLCAGPTTRETRRFLVGPTNCEVTGAFVTPDETVTGGGRPRSAMVIITKDDGGPIGS